MFKSNLGLFWQRVYTSFWFIPAVMSLVGIVLPYLTVQYDLELRQSILTKSFAWLNFTDRAVAHQLLTAVIGSIINVISITFSLTMVVITMAASQYGPQVLRNFMDDAATKFVLGTFVGTFLYCLLSLRILGSMDVDAAVPHVTVALALLLTIFSVGVLIFFIHHVSQSIQVDIIIKRLSEELLEAIDQQFPSEIGEKGNDQDYPPLDRTNTGAVTIPAKVGGYIQSISGDDIITCAADLGCVVDVQTNPGDFVVPGDSMAMIYPTGKLSDKDIERLDGMFIIGARRTPIQDIRYTIEKLSEIALRALSPGVNEPYVAIKCIDYMSLALSILSNRKSPSAFRTDDTGQLRLIAAPVTFETLLNSTFDPIMHYSSSDKNVMQALIQALGRIGRHDRGQQCFEALKHYRQKMNTVIEGRQWEASEKALLLDSLYSGPPADKGAE